MEYLAHISDDGRLQTAAEHCRNTAGYAAEALRGVGLDRAGYLAGLLHDAGKFQHEFQEYIQEGKGQRGSVIHTFQGCRLLLDNFHHDGAPGYSDITSELLAYAVAAHHGLFDCIAPDGNSGFIHRVTSDKAVYNEAADAFLKECAGWDEISKCFDEANDQLCRIYDMMDEDTEDMGELLFGFSALARLILSAVIEGDRKDTASFMDGSGLQTGESGDISWGKYLRNIEEKLAGFAQDTPIKRARSLISQLCADQAGKPSGIYRLNVPTGAGKTLSSLRFAVAHAGIWGKKRIIFTAPLLTIIDQNAKIIREYIGDDTIILEHHSNVLHESGSTGELDERELLQENWSAPVVITTMVQLLNTFFDGSTSSVRRFQALCGSVIVIDEVQTVPNNMLTMFNLMVSFLSRCCDVTFVLCSATQPAFEKADHPIKMEMEDLVPYQPELWEVFKRTKITDAGNMTMECIPGFIRAKLSEVNNLLVICNKKSEAETIYYELKSEGICCMHLSAAMCMAHRREVLSSAERALTESKTGAIKFVLVATQVIEAGVDISFECVVRLAAGMDSVVQAAGRCNRNAESAGPAQVYIVNCADEDLRHLRQINDGKTASQELMVSYEHSPGAFRSDLSSDEAISYYYGRLYKNMPRHYQDFPVKTPRNTLYSLLSQNEKYADEENEQAGHYFLVQAFKTASSLFEVFDDGAEDVLVPYGKGKELIAELMSMGDGAPKSRMAQWLRQARPYTVSVYKYQKEAIREGDIYEKNGVSVLSDGFYSSDTGFSMKKQVLDYLEV